MIVFGRTYVLLQMFYLFILIARYPRCVGRLAWSFERWSDL